MQIIDLLAPSRVLADVHVTSKKRLLETLAQLLDDKSTPATERAIFDCLCKREKLGSTGLGHGVALPHGRSPLVSRPLAAFVRLAEPVDFAALDSERVDLVFGLVVPEHFIDQHLMLLAEVAERFGNAEFRAALRKAPGRSGVFAVLNGLSAEPAAA